MRYIKSIPARSELLYELIRYGEGAIKRLRHSQHWGFPHIYTIMPGDTLEGILRRVMGLKASEIYNEYIERFRILNPHIGDINTLRPGERIYLPMRFLEMEDIIRIEMLNDLIPLYRLIESRARRFKAGIAKPESNPNDNAYRASNDTLDTVIGLYKEGRYIGALERLQPLLYQAEGIDRERLELLQADILRSAGEHFLMENILKGLFVYSRSKKISNKAFHRLSDYYKEVRDDEGLIGLYSTYILKTHDMSILPEFLGLLIDEGEYEMALKAGLLLPEESQPVQALLRACLVESWWQAFNLLIERLRTPEERNLWMAKSMLRQGRYREALDLFMKAGGEGIEWYNSMVEADSIYRGLRNAGDRDIYALIKRWQRWQKAHPGPFRWRTADELLIDSSGALILYNRARNLYHRMFLSKKGRTVRFRVYGPTRLRIEVRPLFDKGPADAYNGWIELRDNGVARHYPLIDNLPSDTFMVSGRRGLKAGQRVMLAYDVTEGLHHIEVYSDTIPLLVSLYSAEPEVRVSILPPLSIDTLSAITGGGLRELIRSIIDEVFVKTEASPLLSIRDRYGQEPIREMIELLWKAEHEPGSFGSNLKRAEEIFINNRHIPRLKRLISRFYRKTRLVLLEDILSSAGIRILRTTGEASSVPEMRIRTSMLRPLMIGEQLLYGYERIVLDMKNLREKDIEAEISLEGIAYLPIEPMGISFEIDGERVRDLRIGEDGKRIVRLHLRVGEGEHYLRIGINRPVTNQFLRVRLWEDAQGKERPLIKTIERRYYLATQDEPVTIAVQGPLMLYIEKRVNGQQTMSFMGIDEGLHTIDFYPGGSWREALYRFYRRVPAPERPLTPRRRFVVEYKEAERPSVRVNGPPVIRHLEFDDAIPLGSQEDGTWSITGAFVKRRQVEIEERMEEFIEFRLTHRFFDEPSRNLKRFRLLGRIREHGGPVIGASGHITYRPLETPYNYNLNASLYVQRPTIDGGYEYSLNMDASVIDRKELGTKTYHTPSIAAFLRMMSMDDHNGYSPQDVDQDIFTPYKAEHRYGLRASDTLFYRPWLDSIISLHGEVVLNEDLNPLRPDNIGLEAGWRQLIGPLQAGLSYQETHYLPDRDRGDHITTRRIGLDLSFERWLNLYKRVEAGLRFIWHLNINRFSGRFYLSIHLSRARGYRDFAYGETGFRDLRQMHISYEEENNRIIKEVLR
jgi:tetratricopeptide (TPR) repeat protein